ncbi:hypothetical protein J6590_000930 [Homalodisca vitripennis]|nr:hypothetical protein J6590_102598 [Homalodisca vitripennis]KAG8328272.1 hypothetical protein J6590_000930 [Homalodisca vitripennis]
MPNGTLCTETFIYLTRLWSDTVLIIFITMNYLTTAIVAAILASACAAYLPKSANLTAEEGTENDNTIKRSAPLTPSTPVDSEMAASQQGWAPQGYNGPLAIPDVQADGTLAETPEVVAARAAHLAALEFARATNPDMDNGEYDPQKYGDHHYGVNPHVLKNALFYGNVVKDHFSETKAAKEATLSHAKASAAAEAAHALWKAKNAAAVTAARSAYGSPLEQNTRYSGPLAMLQLLDSGFLADTPEVAGAKKIHLNALAEALAAAELWRAKNTQHQPWN